MVETHNFTKKPPTETKGGREGLFVPTKVRSRRRHLPQDQERVSENLCAKTIRVIQASSYPADGGPSFSAGNADNYDVCKKATKLDGCCCDGAVLALWSLQLPSNIRAHISGKVFNKNTYKQVFQDADEVYLSSKQVTVAALMSESSRGASALDETLPAFSQQNQPQVAAVSSNKGSNSNSGSGNGGKNKKNKNKNQNQSRGQKHNSVPDNLAEKMCDRHYRHGAGAWYCLQPSSCPWASKTTSKQQ